MTNIMQVPQGEFKLNRYPFIRRESLRAWDAADEYLLKYISENISAEKPLKILVVNDNFGALVLPLLAANDVTLWSDSYLSQQGVKENLKENAIKNVRYTFLNSTETPAEHFDVILLKVPKSNALLEDQLCRLVEIVSEKTIFISAAMAKNIHTSTLNYFENIIGETKTSLALKKARLIFTRADYPVKNIDNPYPKSYQFDGFDYMICNHSNVFSRDKLDIGTRFLLGFIPVTDNYKTIVDMGCGNGLVGLAAAAKNPAAAVVFADESFMAVDSAKTNFETSGLKNKAEFHAMDCLKNLAADSADLILNNPPFHQQHAIGDSVAWRMFNDARNVLRKGGEMLVVSNRHLGYHSKLKKIFDNCEQIASNQKFVILKVRKK